MIRRACLAFCLVAIGLCPAGKAHAASCTVSETSIVFGSFSVLDNVNVDSAGTLTVDCSGLGQNQPVFHCLSIGAGSPAGDATSRKMSGPGGATLRFDLYSNSARSTLWGSWVTGYDTAGVQFNSTGPNTASTTVYARVSSGQQSVAPGSYSATFATDPTDQWVVNPGSGSCPSFSGMSTSNGSFTVTATVLPACNVSTTTLNFGSASFLTSNIDATATVSAQCSNTLPYSIGLNSGSNASGSQRRMKQGASNFISYNLYTDINHTSAWTTTTSTNSCTGGTGTCVTGTGTGSNQNITVFGRVPPQTAPAIGSFTDTVVVTVTF